jgi:hypothetical protein
MTSGALNELSQSKPIESFNERIGQKLKLIRALALRCGKRSLSILSVFVNDSPRTLGELTGLVSGSQNQLSELVRQSTSIEPINERIHEKLKLILALVS